jgi:hypothetical protein
MVGTGAVESHWPRCSEGEGVCVEGPKEPAGGLRHPSQLQPWLGGAEAERRCEAC